MAVKVLIPKDSCKCPHCGRRFKMLTAERLIPWHRDNEKWVKPVCPGSYQCPRGLEDKRLLWKDDPDVQVNRT